MNYAPPEEYINVAEGLGRVRGNEQIYKVLMNSFLANPQYAQMQAELQSNDAESAAKTAHAIKGIAANLSLPKLYGDIVLLEGQLKGGAFTADAVADVESSYAETFAHVQKLIGSM